jgi:hypothetical protein
MLIEGLVHARNILISLSCFFSILMHVKDLQIVHLTTFFCPSITQEDLCDTIYTITLLVGKKCVYLVTLWPQG